MNDMKRKIETTLVRVIKEYEDYCNANAAQSLAAKELLKIRRELFSILGLESCAHNAAMYGSKRYKNDKFHGINHVVTNKEYKELIKLQQIN